MRGRPSDGTMRRVEEITTGVGAYLTQSVRALEPGVREVVDALVAGLPAAGEQSVVGAFWVAYRAACASAGTDGGDLDPVVRDLDGPDAERLLHDVDLLAAEAERQATPPFPSADDLRRPWDQLVTALTVVADQTRAADDAMARGSVIFDAWLAHRWLERVELDALEGSSLDGLTWRVLCMLSTVPFTVDELALAVYPEVKSFAVHQVVHDCTRRKLVVGGEDTVLRLTPWGRQVLAVVTPAVERARQRVEQALPVADMNELRLLMRRLAVALAAGPGDAQLLQEAIGVRPGGAGPDR